MKKSVTVSELSDLNETFVSTFSGKTHLVRPEKDFSY